MARIASEFQDCKCRKIPCVQVRKEPRCSALMIILRGPFRHKFA